LTKKEEEGMMTMMNLQGCMSKEEAEIEEVEVDRELL